MKKVSVKKASTTIGLLALVGFVIALVSSVAVFKQLAEAIEDYDEDESF